MNIANQHQESDKTSSESEGHLEKSVFGEDRDIDDVIQQTMIKTNLSLHNVKSILHHVLKDKRVLAVAQRQAAQEEGREIEGQQDDDVICEPKLTRSRVREAVASSIASGAMSPEKIARMRAITRSPTRTGNLSAEDLFNQTLQGDDSSDDEEYDPTVEPTESEDSYCETEVDDFDTSLANTTVNDMEGSDQEETASTAKQLPPSMDKDTDTRSEEAIVRETAALLASLSDVILSPMKSTSSQSLLKPENSHEDQYYGYSEELCPLKEGEIAKRTRSKYPLNDTLLSTIEESFNPPDADDTLTPLELDDDDIQWHQWLNDLMLPPDSQLTNISADEGDDREDTEYNYLADQDVEEKEEFRNDRAVKIPRKEVDELLNELLNPPTDGLGGILSVDGMDLTSAYLLESLGLQTPTLPEGLSQTLLGPHQEMAVDDSVLMTGAGKDGEGSEVGCYLSCEQAKQTSEQIRQHFQLLMQTFVLSRFEPSLLFLSQISAQAVTEISRWSMEAKEGKKSAVWFVPDVEEGLELLKQLDPTKDLDIPIATHTVSSNKIPEGAQHVVMTSPLFWTYPHLLPAVGFSSVTKDKSGGFFSIEEDCLLVLGMDHYGPVAWQQIQNNILPTKTIKQLQLRVKNQNSKRTRDNVIKHYKKTKVIKIPFNKGDSTQNDQEEQKPRELPQWITQYHKKRLEREKEQKQKKREKLARNSRVMKMIGSLINSGPTRIQPKGMPLPQDSAAVSEVSSRRNIIAKLDEVSGGNLKRPRIDTSSSVTPTRNRSATKRKRANSKEDQSFVGESCEEAFPHTKNVSASVEHLLLAAGLEPADQNAKFAYSYLSEVKETLSVNFKEKYNAFLDILVTADKNHWDPVKIFQEVRVTLQPWPHLVQLFTEMLWQDERLEADVMEAGCDIANIKSFVEALQEKFTDTPLGLQQVIDRLKVLDTPDVTAHRVEKVLLPLIDSHQELVFSLRRFLYQLAPSPREGDVYEDISLIKNSISQVDDFETIIMPKSSPSERRWKDVNNKRPTTHSFDHHETDNSTTHTASGVQKDPEVHPTVASSLTAASQHEKPLPSVNPCSSRARPGEDVDEQEEETATGDVPCSAVGKGTVGDYSHTDSDNLVQTGSPLSLTEKIESMVTLNIPGQLEPVAETGRLGDYPTACSVMDAPAENSQTTWTRYEDGVILKLCLQSKNAPLEEDSIFERLATTISRSPLEVKSRYYQLLTLFHSSKAPT